MEEFKMNGQMITNIHEDIVKVLLERLQKNPGKAILTYDELCKNEKEIIFGQEFESTV